MNARPTLHTIKHRLLLLIVMLSLLTGEFAVVGSKVALADVPPGCTELMRNGLFDVYNADWVQPSSVRPALFQDVVTFDARPYAARLGIVDLPNTAADTQIEQTISLPANPISLILNFRYYTLYDGTTDIGDLQYVDIYNVANGQFVARPFQVLRNDRTWLEATYDLRALAGQQIRLVFGVKNDGGTGKAAMYVDNVSLIHCFATPTPIPPPTATFTPIPAAPTATFTALPPAPTITNTPILTPPAVCTGAELLTNGGFEDDNAWDFGEDPIPARYTGLQKRSGNRSVRLGNSPDLGMADVYSYSSVKQFVTIPANATVAQLRWWNLLQSEEPSAVNHPLNSDCQEVILLRPDLSVLRIARRVRQNTGVWSEDAVDLSDLRGQSFYIYFNVVSNGDNRRTWMHIDDASLRACFVGPTPLPAAPAASIPTAISLAPAALPAPVVQQPAALSPVQVAPAQGQAIEMVTATPSTLQVQAEVQPAADTSQARSVQGPVTALPTSAVLVTDTQNLSWWGRLSAWLFGTGSTTEPAVTATDGATARQNIGLNRLGTVAVLLGILVIIALLAMAIIRMLRSR